MTNNSQLICPITLEIFKDPVICDDGNTYERAAIEEWFNKPGSIYPQNNELRVSPLTGVPITTKLITNRAIKDILERKDNQQIVNNDQIIERDCKNKIEKNEIKKEFKIEKNVLELDIHGFKEGPNNFVEFFFSMTSPNQYKKMSQVYICVVDVSASMDYAAIEEANDENFCYSRLDLVKFSLDNIVQNCDDNDYFALIVFSESAEIAFPLTRMTKNGKESATETIYKKEAIGCTNLWSGIYAGLQMAGSPVCKNKNVSMIVLTDGIANQNPPRGVFETLEKQLKKHPVDCSIHTLGYGYDIDCRLLYNIATKLGNGTFCFIPDCYMIGTNVTSLIAKTKSCFVRNVEIEIDVENGDWMPTFIDEFNLETHLYKQSFTTNPKTNRPIIKFGCLDFDQKRDFILVFKRLKPNSEVGVDLTINYSVGEERFTITRIVRPIDIPCQDEVSINEILQRNMFVKMLDEILKIKNQYDHKYDINVRVKQLASEVVEKVKENQDNCYYREVFNTKNEYEGQLFKALSKNEWYEKWGYSHLLYLLSSHIRRFNANFKDPSIQQYGGKLFTDHRDQCEQIFCTLPQPKPSIQKKVQIEMKTTTNGSNKINKPTVNISNVCLNRSADCFTSQSIVTLASGRTKKMCEVEPGDRLMSWNGRSCTVKCVVKSKCWQQINVSKIGNLLITQYHPIFYKNKWSFPKDVGEMKTINCDYLYNMILDCENVVVVDGYECVTWGHNFKEDTVKHPFFGSNKIIECLEAMDGWECGYIVIDVVFVSRDKNTGLINGIYQADQNQTFSLETSLHKNNNFHLNIQAQV